MRRPATVPAPALAPPVQALADRFVFEVAYVRYLGEVLPERSLERLVPATGWTIRQTFNHLERVMVEYSSMLPLLLDGQPAEAAGFNRDEANANQARETGNRPLHEILDALGDAREVLLAILAQRERDFETATSRDRPVVDVVAEWSHHTARHALQMMEALPELVPDPLLLAWLMGSDLGDREDVSSLRQWLRNAAMTAYGIEKEETDAL